MIFSIKRNYFINYLFNYYSQMSSSINRILSPPNAVKGMLQLEKEKFRKLVEFPSVKIPKRLVNRIIGLACVNELRIDCLPRLKTFIATENDDFKRLIFDPDKFFEANEKKKEELIEQIEKQIDSKVEFENFVYQMEFEDWSAKCCFKAILPEDAEFSGFEQCGHIIHLNLRERLLPFRYVIGQILLEKIQRTRTVINKLDTLTNDYRIMDVELLAGDSDYKTEVVEHGIRYKLDYSKVFWNSRLYSVHSKTVAQFDKNSVVFDVFSGIGPFVLPALKTKNVVKAYANDLNPAAIDYLKQNIKLNKICDEHIEEFILNGSEFIQLFIPEKIFFHCKKWEKENKSTKHTFHVVMNLPGYSADHLIYFRGFLSKYEEIRKLFENNFCNILVHCHFFVKANDDLPLSWYENEAKRIIYEKSECLNLEIKELIFNRKVSTRKNMFCARICLPVEYIFEANDIRTDEKIINIESEVFLLT
ncbi:tRNA (guanine(37)-N1)-methyltransferase [Meloidogyne graminicola]|uniref:tRNA (guanine(37)-N1)-methyltransferase n=1 Tax=Meloidogyne graminicola TaxID=189291 RepID=A0A8S9ZQW2_9BILA|nr:tRNA (guanine(37)-N1)-methyltransferase [Meloidogyne graminicola]